MLNVWVFLAEFPPKHLAHLTYLTFSLFRALFFRGPPNTFNIFNISPVLSVFWFFFGCISPVSWTWVHETGEMLNVFLEICSKQGKC